MDDVVAAPVVESGDLSCRKQREPQIFDRHAADAGRAIMAYRQSAHAHPVDDLLRRLAEMAQADDVDLETPIECRGRLALNPRLSDRVARMNDHAQAPYPGTSPYLPLSMVTG